MACGRRVERDLLALVAVADNLIHRLYQSVQLVVRGCLGISQFSYEAVRLVDAPVGLSWSDASGS